MSEVWKTHKPVELGAVGQGRECLWEVFVGVAVEVPFAGEPSPTSEGSEGDDLASTEGGIGAGASTFGLMKLAKIVNHDIKCGEEGVHVEHEQSVPFPTGSGSKPTLGCGHLLLKSLTPNSHQTFKS
jgi:hypothetical protein